MSNESAAPWPSKPFRHYRCKKCGYRWSMLRAQRPAECCRIVTPWCGGEAIEETDG